MSELGDTLSDLEATQQMMEEAEALSNMTDQESQSLGEGMSKGGQPGQTPSQQQAGTLSPGQQRGPQGGPAQGGNTGKSKTPSATKTQKAKSKNAGGDIIARQLIENPNPEVGASVMPSESTGEAATGGSGSAVNEEQVPAHLKDAHKHYFGTLKRELAKKPSGAAPAAPAAAPASPVKP